MSRNFFPIEHLQRVTSPGLVQPERFQEGICIMTTPHSQSYPGVNSDAAALRASHLLRRSLKEPEYDSWIAAPAELSVLSREDERERLGPIALQLASGERIQAACLRMLDGFSVLDWGRMPDAFAGKGAAAAILADSLLARMETPARWLEFSRGVHALWLRKGNRFGAFFNEVGESLQAKGLRTFRLGLGGIPIPGVSLLETVQAGGARLFDQDLEEVRPAAASIFGRPLHTYSGSSSSALPKLLPFEFRFQFQLDPSAGPGSTFARLRKDPEYLARRGFKTTSLEPGRWLDFPVIELFTANEPIARPLELEEALAISLASGFSLEDLQWSLMATAWVAGFQRQEFETAQIQLRAGRLRWVVLPDGTPLLASLPGSSEFQLESGGIPLTLALTERFYEGSPWAKSVTQARELADASDLPRDWKKRVPVPPPALSAEVREWGLNLGPMLVNVLTGRNWYAGAWSLETICTKARQWLPKDGSNARSS